MKNHTQLKIVRSNWTEKMVNTKKIKKYNHLHVSSPLVVYIIPGQGEIIIVDVKYFIYIYIYYT